MFVCVTDWVFVVSYVVNFVNLELCVLQEVKSALQQGAKRTIRLCSGDIISQTGCHAYHPAKQCRLFELST